MYIEVYDLFWGVIGILGAVTLVYLIISLKNLTNLIKTVNDTLNNNKKNIDIFLESLPQISENVTEISDNMKGISEVVTEATAEVVVAKDSVVNNIEIVKDILSIIISTFVKK